MQIIDSNDFNLRTAAYLLKNQDLEFLIIPVLHIGSTEFYQEVIAELNKCDLILYEGVGLKKLEGFKHAYRQFASRLGLVYQGDEINTKKFGSKLIHADFNREIAEQEWKKIPVISRLLFRTLYPIGLFFLSHYYTKSSLAKSYRQKHELDDQFWFMTHGKANSVENFINIKREKTIFNAIDQQIDEASKEIRIGVIYGAGHMKKVLNYLMDTYSFKIVDSWFLTVFWLTDSEFEYKRKENTGANTA
ncbi:hypothetical protein WJR50_33795 [Catalinimonas sp. 4WD22]|uniref:hypothetical protein n=1 Tax=Catalinimonas locisalis TaxID=3133978 RepID=UPI003101120A